MRVESSSGAQPRYRNKNKDDYEQGNQPPEQSHLAQSPTFGEIRWRAPIISTQADTSPVLLLDNYQTSYLGGDQFTDTPSTLDYSLPETPPDSGTSAASFLLSEDSWKELFCATFNQDVIPELMPEGMRNLSSELPDEPAQFEPGSMLGKN
ncbi:hypothetical protein CVT25_015702 [Psilocybe cyanescens]|uniref:Uncharacterized protein n=1 Tax=Psilocybe cyanescens TaxID=93625 RepID=A0A409XPK6_PSICY|nr:hypothetical protein CVT25_015702 [Psilocybe cyanescens]